MTAAEDVFDSLDVAAVQIDAESIRKLPRALALRYDILSVSADANGLLVAMADPADRDAIERVRLATGMQVKAVYAPRELIRERLRELYGELQRGEDAPAIRALDQIHALAVTSGASDVHVEPLPSGGRVRQRVDGMLRETRLLTPELHAQVVSRIKVLAGMDIADRRSPQDGRYAVDSAGRSLDARASSMPTIDGEKLVIRLLDHHQSVPRLQDLGMPYTSLRRFRAAIEAPSGFVVICGPTGSGKTTTCYAALSARRFDEQNLCSVEDPVEVRLAGVAQVQINSRAGVTFAAALRGLLRQDPNVIMVGEMRDEETAAAAASASLSGQLVLTTLHAATAPQAVDRLIEMGVSRQTIAAGLSAVVSQRLLRRLCGFCRTQTMIDVESAAQFGLDCGAVVYQPRGCERCAKSGYSGRVAVFESLFVDDSMRLLIAGGATSVAVAEAARHSGYRPMLAAAADCVLRGETSPSELRRVLCVEAAP